MDPGKLALSVHADLFRQEAKELCHFPFKGQGIQGKDQPSDGILSGPGDASVGVYTLSLHHDTGFRGCEGHLFHGGAGDDVCKRPVTFQLCLGIAGNYIIRLAALGKNQLQRAGLRKAAAAFGVENAFFSVNDRVFCIRGEAHDRNLAALRQIVAYISSTGFLAAAE